jgi:hypothetical protein
VGVFIGISALLLVVTISGFASVYLEGILKQTDIKIGIWHRNFQMAAWSTVLLLCVDIYDRATRGHSTYAFFHNWSYNTVIIVVLQAGTLHKHF